MANVVCNIAKARKGSTTPPSIVSTTLGACQPKTPVLEPTPGRSAPATLDDSGLSARARWWQLTQAASGSPPGPTALRAQPCARSR